MREKEQVISEIDESNTPGSLATERITQPINLCGCGAQRDRIKRMVQKIHLKALQEYLKLYSLYSKLIQLLQSFDCSCKVQNCPAYNYKNTCRDFYRSYIESVQYINLERIYYGESSSQSGTSLHRCSSSLISFMRVVQCSSHKSYIFIFIFIYHYK